MLQIKAHTIEHLSNVYENNVFIKKTLIGLIGF